MRYAIALFLTSCVQWPQDGWKQIKTPCGLTIYQRVDSLLLEEDIVEMERRLVQFVSPFEGDACPRLNNHFAHELDGDMTELEPDLYVAGWAECWNKKLFYHRGSESWREPWNTALWHEMLHIIQGCYIKETPPDDASHPYWTERRYWDFPLEFRP